MQRYLVLWSLGLLVACQSAPQNEVPSDILPPQRIAAILIDVQWIDAEISLRSYANYDSAMAAYRAMEQRVFQKHKIDTASYYKSYRWYLEHPQVMQDVYQVVIDSLSKREQYYQKQKDAAPSKS